MQNSGKYPVDAHLLQTYSAVCRILQRQVNTASTGCLTSYGWSSAFGAPIIGVTWHFVDSSWKLRIIPIATQNVADASKNGTQICAVMEQAMPHNIVVGSQTIREHTATSDNEHVTALATDLYTNDVCVVRCVVHTVAQAVNDVFQPGKACQKYMDVINLVTIFFNQHPKENIRLLRKHHCSVVTQDLLQHLKHNIHTRWHCRLTAMSTYHARAKGIHSVSE